MRKIEGEAKEEKVREAAKKTREQLESVASPSPFSNPPSGSGVSAGFNGGSGGAGGGSGGGSGGSGYRDNRTPSSSNSSPVLQESFESTLKTIKKTNPYGRLKRSKKINAKKLKAFKKVNRKYGQKRKLLKKRLKKMGLSDEERGEFLKLSEDAEKKTFLKEKGIKEEEAEQFFTEIEDFLEIDNKDTEKQREYLETVFGITEQKEQEEILNLSDEEAQKIFLMEELGFSEWTAQFILDPDSVDLTEFIQAVEEAEKKLGITKDKIDATKLSEFLLDALLNGEITGENAKELIDDPENPGEKITRIEALLKEFLKGYAREDTDLALEPEPKNIFLFWEQ